jgi:branched-chain amino acid transport system substrate-binding protein
LISVFAQINLAPMALAQTGTVRIRWIDPLSGAMALHGQNNLRSWQYLAETASARKWAGPVEFEIVPIDGRMSPQDSLAALRALIDHGVRYVVQGRGSGVAIALADAVHKHNVRNPGREIVYLNDGADDPSLTSEPCSFWYFSLAPNIDMKMAALSADLAKSAANRHVYLIAPDDAAGHAIDRSAATYLAKRRPEVRIVGREFHPSGQVRDLAPHIARMKAAGADTIITGNGGPDLVAMVRAARDAGLAADFYTFQADVGGEPAALGAAGAGRVHVVLDWHANAHRPARKEIVDGFRKRFDDDFRASQVYSGMRLLAEGMKRARSTDPVKVAFTMEGLKVGILSGEAEMRASDHQLQQAVHVATWRKLDRAAPASDQQDAGYGWATRRRLAPEIAARPASCRMKRPPKP